MRLPQQAQEIVNAVRAHQRTRPGRLAAVTLGVPQSLPADALAVAVRDALAAAGEPEVEIAARPHGSGLRVLAVEFDR